MNDELVDKTVQALHRAIGSVPGLSKLDEAAYCDVVLEALDVVNEGLEMRKQELAREPEDADDSEL